MELVQPATKTMRTSPRAPAVFNARLIPEQTPTVHPMIAERAVLIQSRKAQAYPSSREMAIWAEAFPLFGEYNVSPLSGRHSRAIGSNSFTEEKKHRTDRTMLDQQISSGMLVHKRDSEGGWRNSIRLGHCQFFNTGCSECITLSPI